MDESKGRQFNKPLTGLILGLAASLVALIPVMILGRLTSNTLILVMVLFLTGLVFLKQLVGPQLTWGKTLGGGILALLSIVIPSFVYLLLYGFIGFEASTNFLWALTAALDLVAFGITFAWFNFGRRSIRFFIPVFGLIPFVVIYIMRLIGDQGSLRERINTLALDLTRIPAEILFTILAFVPLLGLSIALFNRYHPNAAESEAADSPSPQP